MPLMSRMVRMSLKAGIAKKLLDELQKPENQERLKTIAARVASEVRKPENQQRARAVGQKLAGTVRRRGHRP